MHGLFITMSLIVFPYIEGSIMARLLSFALDPVARRLSSSDKPTLPDLVRDLTILALRKPETVRYIADLAAAEVLSLSALFSA